MPTDSGRGYYTSKSSSLTGRKYDKIISQEISKASNKLRYTHLLKNTLTFPTPLFPVTSTLAAPFTLSLTTASQQLATPTIFDAIAFVASLIIILFVSLLAANSHSSTIRPTPSL